MAALNRENEKEGIKFKEHCTTTLNRLESLQTNLIEKVSSENPNYNEKYFYLSLKEKKSNIFDRMNLDAMYETLDPEECKHYNVNIHIQWSVLLNHCLQTMQEVLQIPFDHVSDSV